MRKHIMKLEKEERPATRWVPTLRKLTYEERLRKLNLPKLEEKKKSMRGHDNNVRTYDGLGETRCRWFIHKRKRNIKRT